MRFDALIVIASRLENSLQFGRFYRRKKNRIVIVKVCEKRGKRGKKDEKKEGETKMGE